MNKKTLNRWWVGFIPYVLSLTVVTAAMASSVRYDYDREVNFSAWKKVAWQASGPVDLSIPSQRIRRALEYGFKAKGYTFVERDSADFVIAYDAAAWKETRISGRYYGPAFGRSVDMERVPMGVLQLHVIDAKTGRIAWRGAVSGVLAKNGDEAEKKTAKAVEQLLEKFPPKKG